MAGDRRLDNDLNLRGARMNSGLAKCLITISMKIPSCDRGRWSTFDASVGFRTRSDDARARRDETSERKGGWRKSPGHEKAT